MSEPETNQGVQLTLPEGEGQLAAVTRRVEFNTGGEAPQIFPTGVVVPHRRSVYTKQKVTLFYDDVPVIVDRNKVDDGTSAVDLHRLLRQPFSI